MAIKITRLSVNPRKKRPAKRKARGRKRVVRLKRNPPARNRRYVVEALVRTRSRRFKTYYYDETGPGFTRTRDNATTYSEIQAKGMARKLMPNVSDRVYALRIAVR